MDSDNRKFYASAMMLAILVGLVAYLTFIPVPAANRDIILTVFAVLLGAGSAAIPNLFGDRNTETEKLKERVLTLESHVQVLEAQNETLKREYDRITEMLVQRIDIGAMGRVA